ncbi:MAG: ATP-binding protein [Acidobacteriota bacterium]
MNQGKGLLAKLGRLQRFLLPPWWTEEEEPHKMSLRYRWLWVSGVLSALLVSLTPLVAMTVINIYEYQKAFEAEIQFPVQRQVSNTRRSIEFFLEERRAALNFIIHDNTFEALSEQERLTGIFKNMKEFFGGFVDVGLIDSQGIQRSYVGPYGLKGRSYEQQVWFDETVLRGSNVSDVFLGYRKFPHFVIAVKNEKRDGDFYILRATFNAEIFDNLLASIEFRPSSDVFIVNRAGVLQTPSRSNGPILSMTQLPVPPYSDRTEVRDVVDRDGHPTLVGYAYIKDSPFVLMVAERHETLMKDWITLRRNLLIFLIVSMVLITVFVLAGSRNMVTRIWEADLKRASVLHQIEYTNKMASIGRLAAGVAHEINNPMAIINEKAGLMKDLMMLEEEFPKKEKFLSLVDPILTSVDRCRTITHRLLGFAKRMDVRVETIHMDLLIREVLSFLEKESSYRNITIHLSFADDLVPIQSDRGQLQQVFLNILNNAFAAVKDGGRIDISAEPRGIEKVAVTITDNGVGISEENIKHIFEPFFTTKEKYGTGLGLSITHGIVEKLGGQIEVRSALGEGTSFVVTLPVQRREE